MAGVVPGQGPNGNYVLQKILQLLPPSAWSFVTLELQGAAPELARRLPGGLLLSSASWWPF